MSGLLKEINFKIEALGDGNRGKVSDGYHTFDELYDHRIRLYIELTKEYANHTVTVWCSKKHSDGTEWPGWFILGINKEPGKQISYHLPSQYWDEVSDYALVIDQAPPFDGHTSADVLERLKSLSQ